MTEKDTSSLSLKVHQEYACDVGRCIARIEGSSMKSFKILDGEVIEIRGKRRTVAKCLSLESSDEGKEIICIDGFIRNNIGANTGDIVTVKKITTIPAKKISMLQVGNMSSIDSTYLEEILENTPMMRGDFVTVPYFGGKLTFQVIDTTPTADAVHVVEKTEFDILK